MLLPVAGLPQGVYWRIGFLRRGSGLVLEEEYCYEEENEKMLSEGLGGYSEMVSLSWISISFDEKQNIVLRLFRVDIPL